LAEHSRAALHFSYHNDYRERTRPTIHVVQLNQRVKVHLCSELIRRYETAWLLYYSS